MSEGKSIEEVEYEQRLRRRLKILQEQFKEGKIRIAEGLDVEKSLLAVRNGPDGEVDLDTVDGLVRSMALAVTAIHDRGELKKEASLSEIQNMYFLLIRRTLLDMTVNNPIFIFAVITVIWFIPGIVLSIPTSSMQQ